jgi:hypothetical protein
MSIWVNVLDHEIGITTQRNNHEAQSSTNLILKDEIEKKYLKRNQRKKIKKIRTKSNIKIK